MLKLKSFHIILFVVIILVIILGISLSRNRTQEPSASKEQIAVMEKDKLLCFKDSDCIKPTCNGPQMANIYYYQTHKNEFYIFQMNCGRDISYGSICQDSKCVETHTP